MSHAPVCLGRSPIGYLAKGRPGTPPRTPRERGRPGQAPGGKKGTRKRPARRSARRDETQEKTPNTRRKSTRKTYSASLRPTRRCYASEVRHHPRTTTRTPGPRTRPPPNMVPKGVSTPYPDPPPAARIPPGSTYACV